MIPTKFDYVVAKSVDEAVRLLGQHGPEAKLLSGGHSLIPLMKFRLASPSVLIDIGRVPELRAIREDDDEIIVGGLATHHMLESSDLIRQKARLLAIAASQVGDVQVRNRGTIGGSLVHADPASDLPAAILALGARLKVRGPNGDREIAAREFFVDMLRSAVEANEILTEIRIRKSAVGNGAAYLKVAQSASGFAIVGVATNLTLTAGRCSEICIGITGVATTPYRAREVEARLRNTSLDGEALKEACAHAASGVDALSDIHASGDYRKSLAETYARRSIEAAVSSAGG
jgi:carbon-monoxide dehydrogenase medium subunit